MSSQASALILLGTIATVNIAVAASMLVRPQAATASPKAYGTTPETDPERLKRKAWRLVYFNLGMIGLAALIDALR